MLPRLALCLLLSSAVGACDMDATEDVGDGRLSELEQEVSQGSFAQDPTPVKMSEYWPHHYHVTRYRKHDGSLYMKRVTKRSDVLERWLPTHLRNDPSLVHFSREDHFPIAKGSEQTGFDNAWSMVKRDDGTVWEVGDLFKPKGVHCDDWCWGHGQVYTGSTSGDPAILHGRPGGHRLGEQPYLSYGVTLASSKDLNTSPSPVPGWSIYTAVQLVKKYDTFQPMFGRAKNGAWGRGLGKTYRNVVLLKFQHGTSAPQPRPVCSSHPPGYAPISGARSFWEYSWFAPGVGLIQSALLWDERFCEGYERPHPQKNPLVYGHFIDQA